MQPINHSYTLDVTSLPSAKVDLRSTMYFSDDEVNLYLNYFRQQKSTDLIPLAMQKQIRAEFEKIKTFEPELIILLNDSIIKLTEKIEQYDTQFIMQNSTDGIPFEIQQELQAKYQEKRKEIETNLQKGGMVLSRETLEKMLKECKEKEAILSESAGQISVYQSFLYTQKMIDECTIPVNAQQYLLKKIKLELSLTEIKYEQLLRNVECGGPRWHEYEGRQIKFLKKQIKKLTCSLAFASGTVLPEMVAKIKVLQGIRDDHGIRILPPIILITLKNGKTAETEFDELSSLLEQCPQAISKKQFDRYHRCFGNQQKENIVEKLSKIFFSIKDELPWHIIL